MLEVKIDKRAFERMAREMPGQVQKAAASALKSEGNYMRGIMAGVAREAGPPISPISQALRKSKRSPWQVLAPLMRYDVDEAQLELKVGLVETGKRPINKRAAVLAKKHSRGYRMLVSRAGQRALAAKLQRKYKALNERDLWHMVGGVRSYIPKIGPHAVRSQPKVQDIFSRHKAGMMQRVQRNFAIKLSGRRY